MESASASPALSAIPANPPASDHEAIVPGQISKAPATNGNCIWTSPPKDLAPERIAGAFAYAKRGPALPLRLVQGLDDDVCPPAATRLLAARLPAEACRWVEGVGHDPFAPAMLAASRAAWSELLDLARTHPP